MASNAYTYQRPSEMATRSLLSTSGTKDTSGKSTETPLASSSSPNDVDTHGGKPTLQRKTTNNYEQAAAAATKDGKLPATTADSAAASVTDRPGMARQQSWKMRDFKGQQQGQMLAGVQGSQGYSTTQK